MTNGWWYGGGIEPFSGEGDDFESIGGEKMAKQHKAIIWSYVVRCVFLFFCALVLPFILLALSGWFWGWLILGFLGICFIVGYIDDTICINKQEQKDKQKKKNNYMDFNSIYEHKK